MSQKLLKLSEAEQKKHEKILSELLSTSDDDLDYVTYEILNGIIEIDSDGNVTDGGFVDEDRVCE